VDAINVHGRAETVMTDCLPPPVSQGGRMVLAAHCHLQTTGAPRWSFCSLKRHALACAGAARVPSEEVHSLASGSRQMFLNWIALF
jgi:hypothetical protein